VTDISGNVVTPILARTRSSPRNTRPEEPPMRGARLFACLLFALLPAARADEAFYLKDGDRVVLYGDSITDKSH
jgi:hypothetical protein